MYYYARPLVLLFLLSLAGCSGTASNSAQESAPPAANTESAQPLNPAEITDAHSALAEGKRLLDENLTEPAILALKRAIELDPDLPESHFQLGIAYDLLEMQQEQSGVLTEPVGSETNNSSSKNSNSEKTRKKTLSERSFERAVEAYKKWLDANPKDDNAHFILGRTYAKLMKDEDAEKSFKQAVKLNPDDAEYQTELGAILVLLAKFHEAIEPLKKALEIDPENVRAQELLEDAQAGRQRLDYAKREANKDQANTAVPTRTPKTSGDANSNSETPAANAVDSRPRMAPMKTPQPAANKPPAKAPAKTPNKQ